MLLCLAYLAKVWESGHQKSVWYSGCVMLFSTVSAAVESFHVLFVPCAVLSNQRLKLSLRYKCCGVLYVVFASYSLSVPGASDTVAVCCCLPCTPTVLQSSVLLKMQSPTPVSVIDLASTPYLSELLQCHICYQSICSFSPPVATHTILCTLPTHSV